VSAAPEPGPPHLARLLGRLRRLEGPILQVWGWPGSGKRALLEALLEAAREEGAARALAPAEVETEARLLAALAEPAAEGARWWVAFALPEAALAVAARRLRPGQRLVFAGPRRAGLPAAPGPEAGGGADPAALPPLSWLTPAELALTPEEAAAVWRRETGAEPAQAPLARLLELTGGWYVPLRLAAEASREGEAPDAEEVLSLPAADAFFRHEVLGTLPPELPAALLRLAAGGRAEEEPEEVRRELELRGGWRPGAGNVLPGLLRVFVERCAGPESARPEISVELLGPPRVHVAPGGGGEAREVRWPLRRSLKILACLAVSPQLQSDRDELISAIWPEGDEDTIAKNFHPTLSLLRRALSDAWGESRGTPLPDPLQWINGIYRLSPRIRWRLDVVELEEGLEGGRELRAAGEPEAALEAWERAASRVRGPFLQNVYDAWAAAPRERFQRLHMDLLREMGDLCTELGRFTEALDAYRRVLLEDPLRERVHVALMRVYSRQGRRDLVRRQYDKLASLLAEELGVEPLPETTEEYHRLMI
jgi:DNA-binding SARP family transcriptional activator